MNIESLTNLSIEVGFGVNNFTMKRGSFSYKKKVWNKRKLQQIGIKQLAENQYQVHFKDTDSGTNCMMLFTERNDFIYIDFSGNLPADVNRYWFTWPKKPDEHFYGCGETYSELDLSGHKVRIWVAEHQNAKRITTASIKIKDVVVKDILGLGVDIVATRNVNKK